MRFQSGCAVTMAVCLFACGNGTGKTPHPDDAIIERVFQPAETAYAVVTESVRQDPEFYPAYKRLGERRCLVYLKAWKTAFRESMPDVRRTYYAAFREVYPSDRLKTFEGLKLDGRARGMFSFRAHDVVMSGPGKALLERMEVSVLAHMKKSAQSTTAPSKEEELMAELEVGRSKVCGLTAEMIEAQLQKPVRNAQ
ncbi:MAG: hypothetical protein JHD35_17085 [Sphingopyxis sp.]|nr:hypothetical protein [Sphingopyxis sp.]